MKNYKEVADSVFQRGDKIIADNRRRKKKIVSVGVPIICCILVAAVGFGANWREFVTNDPTNIVEPTNIENPTEDPTNDCKGDDGEEIEGGDVEATGGDGYEEYDFAYERKSCGLNGRLMDYIVKNLDPSFYDWLNKWDEEHKFYLGYYTDSPEKPLLVQVIETFNVPKEYFEELNEWHIQINKENGWDELDDTFTQKEIDALFSRDPFLISEVFASKYAIITNDGLACCPRYYLQATADELADYGITEQQVKEKIDLLVKDEIIIIQDGEILLYYGVSHDGETYGELVTSKLY